MKHAKQSGGRGQYGHCVIEVEPNPGKGYEFVNSITGGVIPKEYIPAIDKGIQDAMKSGRNGPASRLSTSRSTLFSAPTTKSTFLRTGLLCGWLDGHQGRHAKGFPVLLEPIMDVEVVTPEEYLGDVMGRPQRAPRQGSGHGSPRGGAQSISRPGAALSSMFGYATDLRSKTQGRATFTMQFDHYERVATGARRGNPEIQKLNQPAD